MNPRLKARIAKMGSAKESLVPVPSHHDCHKSESPTFSESSAEAAALLLSFSSICEQQVRKQGVSALWDEHDDDPDEKEHDAFPPFPDLLSAGFSALTAERRAPLYPRLEDYHPSLLRKRSAPSKISLTSHKRLRAVSMDSIRACRNASPVLSDCDSQERTASPVVVPSMTVPPPVMVSPVTASEVEELDPESPVSEETISTTAPRSSTRPRRVAVTRKQSLRLAKQPKKDYNDDASSEANSERSSPEPEIRAVSGKDKKGRNLQAAPPQGLVIKTIGRKKFSWKCYPELEQFLIANRGEYLRHSALNYTVEQKQYNNRLTDELLELATQHGYMFDTAEFSFVTVRDRIRCYYKSYVQSAKKRGVLMGYAARKAGLLDKDDLEKPCTGKDARIFSL